MQPVAVATGAFLVVGIRARTTHRIEAIGQTAKIPALWRRFFAEDIAAQILERLPDPAAIAVYANYENGDRGPYSLLIGHKVQTLDRTPKGLSGVPVPAGRYLRFTVEGSLPETPAAGWQEIRKYFELTHEYERAFTADFEVHSSQAVEIYVAVK